MTPERWQTIEKILEGAVDLAGDEQEIFVSNAWGEDAELRADVIALLSGSDAA